MKKTTIKTLTAGFMAVCLLPACSSETTTGVEADNVNTETSQPTMESNTDDTYPDTTYQNPPTHDGNHIDHE
jgi:uncharacterized lipoprotein